MFDLEKEGRSFQSNLAERKMGGQSLVREVGPNHYDHFKLSRCDWSSGGFVMVLSKEELS